MPLMMGSMREGCVLLSTDEGSKREEGFYCPLIYWVDTILHMHEI